MADETPPEREERLQKAEDRLQRAKERHKEEASVPERTRGSGGFGRAVAGIGSFFGEHKIIILAVVGFGIVFYIIMKSRSTTSASTANQQGNLAGNQDANTASALDALQTQLNNLAGVVQGIQNAPPANQNPPTQPPGSGGGGGNGGSGGTVPSTGWHAPLIQQGAWPSNFQWKFGQKVSVGGITYTVGPGSNGIVWGVPGTGWSFSDWNRVPIGPGGKVAIYGTNPADYTPPTLQPLNSQANHSPIYSFLMLSPEKSVPGTDLSHSGVAFGPNSVKPVSHNGHTWSEGIVASGRNSTYARRG